MPEVSSKKASARSGPYTSVGKAGKGMSSTSTASAGADGKRNLGGAPRAASSAAAAANSKSVSVDSAKSTKRKFKVAAVHFGLPSESTLDEVPEDEIQTALQTALLEGVDLIACEAGDAMVPLSFNFAQFLKTTREQMTSGGGQHNTSFPAIYAGKRHLKRLGLAGGDQLLYYDQTGREICVGHSLCSGNAKASLPSFVEQFTKKTSGAAASSAAGAGAGGRPPCNSSRVQTIEVGGTVAGAGEQQPARHVVKVGLLNHKEERFGDCADKLKPGKSNTAAANTFPNDVSLYIHVANDARPAGKGYVRSGRQFFSKDGKTYIGICNRDEIAKKKKLSDYKLLSVWINGEQMDGVSAPKIVYESDTVLVQVLSVNL
ncbi:unnamed protein product [Amoebophrya sp. A120]|nr:unnamed protein product [Amoebophrya sp. A120]|eukprot:GSA120T00021278001.1